MHERRLQRIVEVEWMRLGAGTRMDTTGIVHVEFFHKEPVSDSALQKLSELRNLRSLRFTNTLVSDEQMKYVTKHPGLEMLWLDNTPITDDGVEFLRHLHSLQGLYLKGSKVTPNGAKQLMESLPNCQIDI